MSSSSSRRSTRKRASTARFAPGEADGVEPNAKRSKKATTGKSTAGKKAKKVAKKVAKSKVAKNAKAKATKKKINKNDPEAAPAEIKTRTCDDGRTRCDWGSGEPIMTAYHDTEWCVPRVYSEAEAFEFLSLESAQAGLSWLTVLKKRAGYQEVFYGFDVDAILARDRDEYFAECMDDARIIRNRLKVGAVLNNAAVIRDMRDEGGFVSYVWSFVPDGVPLTADKLVLDGANAADGHALATAMAKDMKKRGFKFVGPSIVASFMQAMGLVNVHADACFLSTSAHAGDPVPPFGGNSVTLFSDLPSLDF